MIRKSSVPVLAIPEGYGYKPIKNVLFPTDYSSLYRQEDFEPLIDIIEKFNAVLHVVHAVEEKLTNSQMHNKELLVSILGNSSTVFQDITDEYMPNIVHSYVEKNQIGLVAMMNRKYTFLQRLLFKQNVDSIGYHCAVPFLVLPETPENEMQS